MQIPPTSMQEPKITTDDQRQSTGKKLRGRVPDRTSFPRKTIDEALRVPQSIWKDNAGNPFPLGDLQKKLKINGATAFQTLVRASQMYGLTVGSWSANPNGTIKLSNLGSAIVAPQIDDKPELLKIEALQKPKVFHDFLQSINNRIIPAQERCESTLVQQYRVGSSVVKLCYSVLFRNVRALDLVVRDDAQNEVLRLDNPPAETTQPEQTQESSPPVETEADEQSDQEQGTAIRDDKPKQIFIAHGKNRTPLEQLEGILRGFDINS